MSPRRRARLRTRAADSSIQQGHRRPQIYLRRASAHRRFAARWEGEDVQARHLWRALSQRLKFVNGAVEILAHRSGLGPRKVEYAAHSLSGWIGLGEVDPDVAGLEFAVAPRILGERPQRLAHRLRLRNQPIVHFASSAVTTRDSPSINNPRRFASASIAGTNSSNCILIVKSMLAVGWPISNCRFFTIVSQAIANSFSPACEIVNSSM